MQWAYAQTFTLMAAAELDLFTALAERPGDVDDLAGRIGAAPRGVRMLCEALVGMHVLRREGDEFALVEGADDLLAAGREGSRLGSIRFLRRIITDWMGLADAVRTGRPVLDVNGPVGGSFFRDLVPALYHGNLAAAEAAAEELKRTLPRFDVEALDVAAGSGVFGIALARAHDGVVVTALDKGAVLEVTRDHVDRYGLSARFHYLPGDLREVSLIEGRFDVAFLGHILHSEGEEQTRLLLRRVASALRTGGTVVIGEFLLDEDRSGPPLSLFFGLNMLIHSEVGDVFTLSQLSGWLEEAGFRDVRLLEADAPSPLLLADKA